MHPNMLPFLSAALSLPGKVLFADRAPEERKLSTPAKYILILVLFVLTRLVAIWGFEMRHVDWLINDPLGYLLTANYILQHGYQPTEDNLVYRQFPGLSLLMIVVNLFTGNMVIAGYVVVGLSAVASLFLIQYLFDDFRLSLISTVFLPFIITTTCTIFSEAPTILCFLIGYWVLRDFRHRPVILGLGLMAAGYAIIIRQPALLTTMPFLFVFAWRNPGGGFWKAVGTCCVASVPLILYLIWNWFTIHEFFPQYKLQHENMFKELAANPNPGHYSAQMYDLPFRSLINGLTDPSERIWKRISEVVTTLIALTALGCLIRTAWRERGNSRGILALAFLAAMVPYFLLLLCLGGNFGYKWMERHLSEINPIIDWALFYHRPLRWVWIALLVVAGVTFAIGTGQGGPFLIFK